MSQADLRQLVVFAAIFTICLLIFDWAQGVPLTVRGFGGILITTGLATAIYALFIRFVKNRNKPKD